MPILGRIHRRDLIRYLRQLGFSGPYPGFKSSIHEERTKEGLYSHPHGGNINRGVLARILRQAGITLQEWERL